MKKYCIVVLKANEDSYRSPAVVAILSAEDSFLKKNDGEWVDKNDIDLEFDAFDTFDAVYCIDFYITYSDWIDSINMAKNKHNIIKSIFDKGYIMRKR